MSVYFWSLHVQGCQWLPSVTSARSHLFCVKGSPRLRYLKFKEPLLLYGWDSLGGNC